MRGRPDPKDGEAETKAESEEETKAEAEAESEAEAAENAEAAHRWTTTNIFFYPRCQMCDGGRAGANFCSQTRILQSDDEILRHRWASSSHSSSSSSSSPEGSDDRLGVYVNLNGFGGFSVTKDQTAA